MRLLMYTKFLSETLKGRGLGRPRRRGEDIIRMYLGEGGGRKVDLSGSG
jgi:hypothetical protein